MNKIICTLFVLVLVQVAFAAQLENAYGQWKVVSLKDNKNGAQIPVPPFIFNIEGQAIKYKIGNMVVQPFDYKGVVGNDIRVAYKQGTSSLMLPPPELFKYEQLLSASFKTFHTIRVIEGGRKIELITKDHTLLLTRPNF